MVLNTRAIGAEGESRAVLFLESFGFEVIAKNWRCASGEVDIIVVKNELIVFVEVKTWESDFGDTLSLALGKKKQKRIVETAKCFLLEYRQYSDSYVRFDVLLVDMFGSGTIKHIENAFSEFE